MRDQVERRPGALAVREPFGGLSLDYRELWRRAGRLAAELVRAGVARGDIVAVDLPRSADLVVAFLGIGRSGAAYLPLDEHAPAERVSGILTESGAAVVVGRPSRHRALPAGVRLVPVPTGLGSPEVPFTDVAVDGEDPIYVTYTSGSTGRPKGVVIPHRAVVRLTKEPNYCVMAPGDRVANTCNPAFDVTTSEIWGALTAGATVVPFPPLVGLEMTGWLALLEEENITTMFLTTSLFHTVAWERPDAFHQLRDLVVGGEQLDLAAARRVLAAGPPTRLVNGYGPTEGTSFASFFVCTDDSLAGVERVPIGHPLQETELYVRDENMRPVRPGETGELCLGGPGVATGYLYRPELTAERFVIDPSTGERVYRTGDLVRELPSGALEMGGRLDRQVKLRGFRIELEEIERAATATGLVGAAFVEKVGEGAAARLIAFVLPVSGDGESPRPDPSLPGRLTEKLTESLPGYMVPARWVMLTRLPVGPTGKADRSAMLASLAERHGADEPETPDCPALHTIHAAVRDVLEIDPSVGDNFVALGGNSLSAMRVVNRLREKGLRARTATVLQAETLADLAQDLCVADCHRC